MPKSKDAPRRLPKRAVAAIRDAKILGVKAGARPHRVIGIRAVVVEGRVFVRSWGLKARRASRVDPITALRAE